MAGLEDFKFRLEIVFLFLLQKRVRLANNHITAAARLYCFTLVSVCMLLAYWLLEISCYMVLVCSPGCPPASASLAAMPVFLLFFLNILR